MSKYDAIRSGEFTGARGYRDAVVTCSGAIMVAYSVSHMDIVRPLVCVCADEYASGYSTALLLPCLPNCFSVCDCVLVKDVSSSG